MHQSLARLLIYSLLSLLSHRASPPFGTEPLKELSTPPTRNLRLGLKFAAGGVVRPQLAQISHV